MLVHDVELIDDKFVVRCLASLIYGVITLTFLQLFIESKNWSLIRHFMGVVIITTVTIVYVWDLFVESTSSTYIYFSLAVGCMVF